MSKTETQAAPAPRSSLWGWWKSLDGEDRAGRAELRRCATAAEVAFTAPYHRLLRRLGSRLGEADARRVAAIAAILAHVDEEPAGESSLARTMGLPRGEGQGSVVSDARFRHLLRNEDPDELLREFVRVIRQLGRTAPVEPLFRDLMAWDEKTRLRWARDYYAAAPTPGGKKA
jgi:CRISPR type I-E-associated protein CasB/Cse2